MAGGAVAAALDAEGAELDAEAVGELDAIDEELSDLDIGCVEVGGIEVGSVEAGVLADGVEVGEVLVGVLIGVRVAVSEVAGGTELEEDKVE